MSQLLTEEEFKEAASDFLKVNDKHSIAYVAYALHFYYDIHDVNEFITNSLVDDYNDKSIDWFYFDESEKRALIAQSYYSDTWGNPKVSPKKAADLNQAITWVFAADMSSESAPPERIKNKIEELRAAINDGSIERIDLFYIHNCIESINIKNELDAVKRMANNLIGNLSPNEKIEISAHEIGINTLKKKIESQYNTITIKNNFEIPSSSGFIEEEGEGWESIVTSVKCSWIKKISEKYGDDLTSVNYRDYLGHSKRINKTIKNSADKNPSSFWAYNNGVTILTEHIYKDINSKISIKGMSIINGGQTTGALAKANLDEENNAKVLLRIIKCTDKKLIDDIIQFNNTQNDIKPQDRRSNDDVQERIVSEFEDKDIVYVCRRGSSSIPSDAIRIYPTGRILAAFHGDLQTAIRNAKSIFSEDSTYKKIFPDNISIKHIFLVHYFHLAILEIKKEFKNKPDKTDADMEIFKVLEPIAAINFILFIIGQLAEEILSQRVSDRHDWKVKNVNKHGGDLKQGCQDVVRKILNFIHPAYKTIDISNRIYDIPRSTQYSKKVADMVKPNIKSISESSDFNSFDKIRKLSEVK